MRITRQTVVELVLEDNSLWLAGVLAIASLPLFYAAVFAGKKGNFVVAGFLVACSLICIRKTCFVFDARERVVRWKNLRFLKASTGSVAFDEIREIGIESSSGGSEGRSGYRLTILTSSGSIPLSYSYGSESDKYATMRETILSFLKPDSRKAASTPEMAAQEGIAGLEPSIPELVRAGRKIDAIALLRSMKKMSLSEAKQRVDDVQSRLKAESLGTAQE